MLVYWYEMMWNKTQKKLQTVTKSTEWVSSVSCCFCSNGATWWTWAGTTSRAETHLKLLQLFKSLLHLFICLHYILHIYCFIKLASKTLHQSKWEIFILQNMFVLTKREKHVEWKKSNIRCTLNMVDLFLTSCPWPTQNGSATHF